MNELGIYRDIAADLRVRVTERQPLAPYTWLKVGGPATVFFEPETIEQAAKLHDALAHGPLPVRILGAGSNLVVADEGIDAAVVATARLAAEPRRLDGDRVEVAAGVAVPGLARWAAREGLAGLEFAEGIPALFGGALRMNAGAHGSSFGAVAESVLVGAAGTVERRVIGEHDFSYRESFVHRERRLALGAVLRLAPDDTEAIRHRMLEYRRRRRATQPVTERSAGCVFANFPGLPIGKLVEDLGLKGTAIGDAEVSKVHGNFIINRGHATAKDILALIELVAERVAAATGQAPRQEVEVWRNEP